MVICLMSDTAIEIERKFLMGVPLHDIITQQARAGNWLLCENIQQVYMPDTGEWAIRGRKTSNGSYNAPLSGNPPTHSLTMKRRISRLSADEIETDTSEAAYLAMVDKCGHRPLMKDRWHYHIHHVCPDFPERNGIFTFTIDEFLNREFNGLVMAEIELTSEEQWFPRPQWLGEEVTGLRRYTNADMVKRLRF